MYLPEIHEDRPCPMHAFITLEWTSEPPRFPSEAKAEHNTVLVQALASGASCYLKRMGWG